LTGSASTERYGTTAYSISARQRVGGLATGLAGIGVLLFLACAPISIVAYEVGWGLACLGVIAALALGGRYRRTPLDLPLALFVAAELLSIVFSQDRARSLRSMRGEWILLSYPLFVQAIRDARALRRGYAVLGVSATLVAAYAIWQVFAGHDPWRHIELERIGGLHFATAFFNHHLTYGGSVLITALLAFGLLFASGARAARLRWAIALAAQTAALAGTFARTAWAGFLAALAGAALSARREIRRVALALGGAAIVVALLLPPIQARLGSPERLLNDPRIRLWRTALRIWRDHPITGSGIGTYAGLFERYKVPGEYAATNNAHCEILNLLAGSGLLGVAAFAFLWYRFFRAAAGAYRRLAATDSRRALLLAGMLAAGGILVGGLGQCFLLDEEVAVLLWFVVAGTMVTAGESGARA
jgi:O-antigen ligase